MSIPAMVRLFSKYTHTLHARFGVLPRQALVRISAWREGETSLKASPHPLYKEAVLAAIQISLLLNRIPTRSMRAFKERCHSTYIVHTLGLLKAHSFAPGSRSFIRITYL